MIINFKKSFLPPILLLVFFLIDGVLAALFSKTFYDGNYILVPRLIVIIFVLMSFYLPRNKVLVYAIVFGLLYDSYYSGILGVYVALFPIIVYITEKLKKVLNPNPLVVGMMLIINVSIIETVLYFFYQVLGVNTMDFNAFLAERMGPTLLLNSVIFIFLYYPLKKLISKLDET
ncbi:rod shape-determining protein MreD [Carnobacterium gallinarum]|uniref:rod shape-determining protein MreD n=1 Tax=Carnobacterium gallinarum TaxID=2749 RepID=UPI000555460E|nr:rod shape-determining protein MreD [Carnobacterium gallinarum]